MPDVSPSVAACMSDMAAEILALRTRLAEVEAERDALRCKDPDWCGGRCNCTTDGVLLHRAIRAEAHLAAVEALCDQFTDTGLSMIPAVRVRAATRGEGDRPGTCPPHRYPDGMPSEVIAWRCAKCGEVIRG